MQELCFKKYIGEFRLLALHGVQLELIIAEFSAQMRKSFLHTLILNFLHYYQMYLRDSCWTPWLWKCLSTYLRKNKVRWLQPFKQALGSNSPGTLFIYCTAKNLCASSSKSWTSSINRTIYLGCRLSEQNGPRCRKSLECLRKNVEEETSWKYWINFRRVDRPNQIMGWDKRIKKRKNCWRSSLRSRFSESFFIHCCFQESFWNHAQLFQTERMKLNFMCSLRDRLRF